MTKARDLANAGTALGAVSATELGYVDGVTSAIQTQIDTKAPSSTAVTLTGTQTLTNKTLTNPVIASVVNNTLTSTTGDMIYASAANTPARLGIGSSAQVLTVAGGIPSWSTPVSGSMTLLSTTTLSGATVTVSSISQSYLHLYIAIDRFSLDGAAGEMYLQPNSSGSIHVLYSANAVWSNSTGAFLFTNGGAGQNGTNNSTGAWIMNYSATNMYKPMMAFGGNTTSSTSTRAFINGGMLHETSAVTSVMIRPSANNFNGGTMRIYGVN